MKNVAESARPLRATVGADGLVHHVDGRRGGRSIASGRRPTDFADALSGRVVRIPACRDNAALICVAYGHASVVELGRPPDIDWDWDAGAAAPGETLAHARDSATGPSIGGWHAMTVAELSAYALAAELDAGRANPAVFEVLLVAHPAWPALSFIPHLDPAWVCFILASILDPRWWVDPAHPDRVGRLKHAFGLVSADLPSGACRRARRHAVLAAWKTAADVPAAIALPGYFLWRCWAAAGGRVPAADLKASRLFLAYLRATWLDGLLGAAWCPDRLFVPEYFFGDDATAAAWRRHVAAASD